MIPWADGEVDDGQLRIRSKYSLYAHFGEICLTERQYKIAEKHGVVPAGIRSIFAEKEYKTPDPYGFLEGNQPAVMTHLRSKLILETWTTHNRHSDRGRGLALFFFDSLLVICYEPWHVHDTHEESSVIPVAIPMKEVLGFKAEYGEHVASPTSSIVVELSNGEKLKCPYCQRTRDGRGIEYISGQNWAFAANGFSRNRFKTVRDATSIVVGYAEGLLEKADLKSIRRKCIAQLGLKRVDTRYLEDYLYVPKELFYDALLQERNAIREAGKAAGLADALDRLEDAKSKQDSELARLRLELREKEAECEDKREELQYTGSFDFKGKIEIKKQLREIENSIAEYNRNINNLDYISKAYNNIGNTIIKMIKNDSNDNYNKLDCISVKLYSTCIEKNLDIDDGEAKPLIEVIARQLGIVDDGEAARLYGRGRDLTKAGTTQEKHAKRILDHIVAVEAFSAAKDQTAYIGQAKYLAEARRQLEQALSTKAWASFATSYAMGRMTSKADTSDWAIAGGMMDGLFGSGAGMAAAVNTIVENQAAEARAMESRKAAHEILNSSNRIGARATIEATSLKDNIDAFNNKICDKDNTKKYFEYVDCNVINHEVLESGDMRVHILVALNKPEQIAGMNVVIDGSLAVCALSDGKLVGRGYLCAPGFGDISLKTAGFRNMKECCVSVLAIDGSEFDEGQAYDFEIVPLHLWAIEE